MTSPSTRNGHGTRACYLRGCRRPECRSAHARYCKEYALDRYRNGGRRIDPTSAAQHVQQLVAAGCTISGIVEGAGVSHYTVVDLANDATNGILPDTELRILSFHPEPDDPARGHWTNAIGTCRRIRALAVLGHPVYTVADAACVAHSTLRHIATGMRGSASKDVAAAVADVYAQWMTRPGPSDITRRRAAVSGWHGPLAWDDIDDPDEQPDTDGGEETPLYLARAEDGLWLEQQGYTRQQIADRLGTTREALQQNIARARKAGYGEAA